MKMKKFYSLIMIIALCFGLNVSAQERYIDEIFTDVEVTSNELYGVNATVLLVSVVGEAVPQPLFADIYKPVGDDETARPLVIYAHTGNFLPHPQNGSPSGTKTDSTVVEICTRLAKMGYVVASIDYRLGWNPLATTQIERTATLINAAYRGVQDARTSIKYFKRTVAEFANPHGIDPGKIVLWGQGTGGYISLACAGLDDYNKVLLPKFFLPPDSLGNQLPMVIEPINGDIYVDSVGIVPPGYPVFPAGDTLCYPNHVGYDTEFDLCVNVGGAMADSSWLDPGDIPLISIQTPTDPFAPYTTGVLIVPTTNEPVVEVSGSYDMQTLQSTFGNNAAWLEHDFIDPFSTRADMVNDGLEGLFPVLRGPTQILDSSPWDFWDPDTNENHANGLLTNPDMTDVKAKTFIDSIVGYYAPRACITLDLGCDLQGSGITTSIEDIDENEVGLFISPNPGIEQITFTTSNEFPIEDIYVYDLEGRLVSAHVNIQHNVFELQKNALTSGMYIAELRFADQKRVAKKVLFK